MNSKFGKELDVLINVHWLARKLLNSDAFSATFETKMTPLPNRWNYRSFTFVHKFINIYLDQYWDR